MKELRHYDQIARRLATVLAHPDEQLDPSWRPVLHIPDAPAQAKEGWPGYGEDWGPRLGLAVFNTLCGRLPDVSDFDHAPAQWCLLPREQRLARLAALALAANPGAVRACVRRTPRQALEAVLGPAYEALVVLGAAAAAAPPEVAERAPAAWALDGYYALVRARLWPSRSVRRWVRLGLPHRMDASGMGGIIRMVPSAKPRQIQEVDAWFGTEAPMKR